MALLPPMDRICQPLSGWDKTTVMRQFTAIAANTFMELVRQPIFLLLTTASAAFCVFLSCVSYFGFGDDPKLVKSSVLAVMLLAGLLGAVLSASNTLAREIRTGTALAVLSKPVGRAPFLLAKYLGLAGALTVLNGVNMVACLLASRMAFDAYGDADLAGLAVFLGGVVLAYAAGAFSNYFLRRPFASDALFALVVTVTVAFFVVCLLPKPRVQEWKFAQDVDWRIIPASVLVLFALWVLAGLALACSTRLELISTLAICSGLFLVGLMSDYLVGRPAEAGAWWAKVLYPLIPNWQQFWMADALSSEQPTRWGHYLLTAFGYTASYVGATLALALCFFEDRELS